MDVAQPRLLSRDCRVCGQQPRLPDVEALRPCTRMSLRERKDANYNLLLRGTLAVFGKAVQPAREPEAHERTGTKPFLAFIQLQVAITDPLV